MPERLPDLLDPQGGAASASPPAQRAPLRLSILDFGHPLNSAKVSLMADRLGYHRYWVGEHHNTQQCSNPLLLSSFLAHTTQGIRLGTGAICLSYHSPYLLAEDARLVEMLAPGRIDVGVTRGLPLDEGLLSALLDGRPLTDLRSYNEKLRDFHGFLTGRLPYGNPLHNRQPNPRTIPMWVLGTGIESARWAARNGTGFCFSLHHAPEGCNGHALVEEYSGAFTPSAEFAEASMIIVASGVCITSTKASPQSIYQKTMRAQKKPTFQGPPEFCADQIRRIAAQYKSQEIMILDMVHYNTELRLEMYAHLAECLQLTPRSLASG